MDFNKYKNTKVYPNSADYTTVYWYRAGKVVCTQRPGESLAAGFDTTKCIREKVIDDAALAAAAAEWRAEQGRLTEMFRQDLIKELDIEDHPMRNKLLNKAWEDGHSSGLQEVYHCALNLVDLIEIPEDCVLVSAKKILFGAGTRTNAVADAAEKLARKLRG